MLLLKIYLAGLVVLIAAVMLNLLANVIGISVVASLDHCGSTDSNQGSTQTTNESSLSAAFAVTSQHPSVGKYKPVA